MGLDSPGAIFGQVVVVLKQATTRGSSLAKCQNKGSFSRISSRSKVVSLKIERKRKIANSGKVVF